MHFLSTWRQVFVTFRIARCTWVVLGLFGADSRLGPTCYGSAARRPAVSRAGASGPSGGGGGWQCPTPAVGDPRARSRTPLLGELSWRADAAPRRPEPSQGPCPRTGKGLGLEGCAGPRCVCPAGRGHGQTPWLLLCLSQGRGGWSPGALALVVQGCWGRGRGPSATPASLRLHWFHTPGGF